MSHKLTEKENCLIAYRHGVPEWIPVVRDAICHLGFWAGNELGIRGEEVEPGITLDNFGCRWDQRYGMPMADERNTLLTLDTLENWRDIVKIPRPEEWDWEMLAGGELAHYDPNKVMVYFCEQGCFDRLITMLGFEDTCVAMLTEPEICYDIFGMIADYKIELIRCVKKYLNPDVFQYTDDIAELTGLMISLDTYRELLKPHHARIIAAIKENGMIAEVHTCGNCFEVLDDYVEIGVDSIFPASACNNIPAVKKKYGNKLVVCGGFDSQGLPGRVDAPRDVEFAEAKRVVEDCAKGGCFIFAPTLLGKGNMLVVDMVDGPGKDLYEGFLEYRKDFYADPKNRVFPE
jgi:hypothetical protein